MYGAVAARYHREGASRRRSVVFVASMGIVKCGRCYWLGAGLLKGVKQQKTEETERGTAGSGPGAAQLACSASKISLFPLVSARTYWNQENDTW